MAKEYIEREAVKKLRDDVISGKVHFDNEYDMIDAVPAADVVEVRHGRWINDGEDWFCNRCNHNALCDKMTGLQVASVICPNCGAKMDGENVLIGPKNKSRCRKCVYEITCTRDRDNDSDGTCPDYQRDAQDGGYYG